MAAVALLLALAQPAPAANIAVNTNTPAINDGDGKCSLIEAIINANDDASTHPDCAKGEGADVIVLPAASIHVVEAAYGNYQGETALPVITSEITIEGNNSTVTRHVSEPLFRILAVRSVGRLTLQNLTVSGGAQNHGGGIFNSGTLAITNSIITGNKAQYFGGGIFNSSDGELTIETSSLSKNIANMDGGGLLDCYGSFKIQNSTISGNFSQRGGGIHKFDNQIEYVTPTSNFPKCSVTSHTGLIVNSTIYGNTSSVGGGIANGGKITIINSTISNNVALAQGGGIINYKPFQGAPSYLFVESSTISQNIAGDEHFGWGGGIMNQYNGYLYLSRSIVSGNKALTGPEIKTASVNDVVYIDDFNLLGNNGDSGLYNVYVGYTDIVPKQSLNKILGPLKNNGGPTLTHALVPGSPALDAAPVDANCPATDGRGVARPQGSACDMGAVEGTSLAPAPHPTGHNFVVSSVKAPKTIKNGGGTAPVAVTIRNAGNQNEILSDASVLGDGATTGLVRLAIDVTDTDGEQCQPATVSLDGSKNGKLFSKGVKVLSGGASLTVNFLVTYRCDAPMNKRNPEAGDYRNSASIFPDELDGISDSNASSTMVGAATKVTP